MADNEVSMMMSVYPGAMTGFAALNSGLVSINNIFMQTMARIDDNFGLIDTSIVATGAVVAQFAVDSMHAFGEFEQGMKIVQMVSGQTANDISYLSQKANEFSVSYRTDIDQITEGLQTLGRAGLNSASEQAEVLQNGLSTAKLEGRDLNGVLQELIQNTALLGGNLKSSEFGEDSQYINDLLVATSMTAPITTHDISETLKYSGGIAAAAGAHIRDNEGNVDEQGKAILEDYMGAIAAFAQKGVSGSIAGTALRAFFNKPATQDSSVTDALASIHLSPESLWEDDEETMKPVSEQIAIIKNQMDELNISTMDQLQIWSKIVGGKMGQQMMKLDAENIKDITKDIRAADDATSLAQRSMKTYEANIKAIGESGAALQRNIGQGLVTVANPFLEIISRFLEFANNDFMGFPIAMTIIGFLGMVAKRIKAIIAQLFSEIGTVFSAIKAGANMITARDLKGEKGKRDLLPGEKYTQNDLQKDVTPGNLLKQFRQQFQNEAAKSLVGLSKENAAIVEASKGWSKESEYLNSSKNVKYVSDDGKSFMQARDNQVIAQLARHNLLSPEVQKAFFMGTKKEEIMSTPLSSGLTVREEIERTFIKLQTELQKTATVLNEASVAAESASASEQREAQVKTETSTKAAEQASIGYKQAKADFDAMWKGILSSNSQGTLNTEEMATQNTITVEEMSARVITEFNEMAASVSVALSKMNSNVKTFVPTMYPNRMTSIDPRTVNIIGTGQMPASVNPEVYKYINHSPLGDKVGIPLTYAQNMALLFGGQYGNLKEVERKGFTPFTGQMPWFMAHLNTPRDLYKFGINEFNTPTEADVRDANSKLYHSTGTGASTGQSAVAAAGKSVDDINKEIKKTQEENLKKSGHNAASAENARLANEEIYKKEYERNQLMTEELIKERQIHDERAAYVDHGAQADASGKLKAAQALQKDIDAKQAEIDKLQGKTGGSGRPMPTGIWSIGLNEKQKQDLDEVLNKPRGVTSSLKPKNLSENVHDSTKDSGFTAGPQRFPKNPVGPLPGTYSIPQLQQALDEMKKPKTPETGAGIGYMAGQLKSREQVSQVNELIHTERTLGERIRSLTYRLTGRGARLSRSNQQPGMLGTFWGTLKDRWNQDRSGRFLNFGSGRIGGKLNGILNLTDAIGGPFMIAMMGFSAIINYVRGLYEEYSQELKKAKESVKEAYGERQEAENKIKQTFREQNPDAEKEAATDYLLEQYGAMYDSLRENNNNFSKWIEMTAHKSNVPKQYEMDEEKDDGTMKEVEEEELSDEEALQEAINENSAALYAATAELQLATSKLVTKMQDGVWGVDGLSSGISDLLGKGQDTWFGLTEGSGSIENGFLKTASQKDENYAGDTELTGLMLEDFKDAQGDWRRGLKTIFGSDFEDVESTMNPKAIKGMYSMAQFSKSLGSAQNSRLQSSMMNDRKSWQMLAKEMAKYEKKTGKHAMNVQDTKNQRMENLIKKLQIDTHLNRSQVIAAAQLQQLQDMYQVAEQAFVPLMSDQAATANQLYKTTADGVLPQTGNAAGGAVGTQQNSAAIAAYLSVMAQNAAIESSYNQDLLEGKTKAKSKEEYLQEAVGTHIKVKGVDEYGSNTILGDLGLAGDYYFGGDIEKQKRIAHSLEYQGDRIRNPDWTDKEVSDYSKRITKLIDDGMNFADAMELARKNYAGAAAPMIEAAYLASGVGEDEGTGSGGGSDSGSGDKDKDNTGTKKERVDLVLCSKKEIPKLNVNLFKKPPTFTVLNKNFKVRDVKINTEDKPKAIMSAIKNSFIDVQKRSDPKIIQDEDAVYDPEGATDGNPLPSGSAKTKTD